MANKTVQIQYANGRTGLKLRLYPQAGGAIVNGATGDDAIEHASTPGLYESTVTEVLSGVYIANLVDDVSGSIKRSGYVRLVDVIGTYIVMDPTFSPLLEIDNAGAVSSNLKKINDDPFTVARLNAWLKTIIEGTILSPGGADPVNTAISFDVDLFNSSGASLGPVNDNYFRNLIFVALDAETNQYQPRRVVSSATTPSGQIRLTLDEALDAVPQTPGGLFALFGRAGAESGLTQQQVADALKLAPTAGSPAEASVNDTLDEIQAAIGSSIGPGANQCTLTITNASAGNAPIADADVWITSDQAGTVTIAGTLQTDSNGEVLFMLDNGSVYYLWMQKDGVTPIEGQQFTAVAD